MNAPQSYPPIVPIPNQKSASEEEEVNLASYLDILYDSKWTIVIITVLALVIGIAYVMLTKPVYEADLLIQIEDNSGASAAQSLLGNASSLFDVKTPAAGEIEIMRSRMVLGRSVDNTRYYIDARPNYIPVIGNWLARRATDLSDPGFLGIKGYVSGTEKIVVSQFDVPTQFEGQLFTLTVQANNKYVVNEDDLAHPLQGTVGTLLDVTTPNGKFKLMVSALSGKPGAEFNLTRASRTKTMDDLQNNIDLTEKGHESGIVSAVLRGTDSVSLVAILNEIGKQYVRQNIERKAAEAEKSLTFLDNQLPQFKKQLESAEDAYSRFRNEHGTIALDEEAKVALHETVDLQTQMFTAQQQKRQLEDRFTSNHPTIQTLTSQIAAWQGQINKLNSRIKNMPAIQQAALRFESDIKVDSDLYQSMLNNALQLRLVSAGKIGNVRLLDEALPPIQPVKPQKVLVVALALILGLFVSVLVAVVRNSFFSRIRSADEIEAKTGLSVYSTTPLSTVQRTISQRIAARAPGIHVLANSHPNDVAVESLRSLRTALQFAMLEAPNNRVLITGATPSLGKSFISTNFAAILAAGGKRILLIDADLRKGHINHFFGLAREHGLSDLLSGSITASEATHADVLPGLSIITTGTMPPNPAELLMSDAFGRLLTQISGDYDVVLIDSPPVLVAADTVAVSQHAGIILMIARAEATHIGELRESAKRFAQAGRTVNGVLFNGVDFSRRYNGTYGYRYGGYRYAQYDYSPQGKRKARK